MDNLIHYVQEYRRLERKMKKNPNLLSKTERAKLEKLSSYLKDHLNSSQKKTRFPAPTATSTFSNDMTQTLGHTGRNLTKILENTGLSNTGKGQTQSPSKDPVTFALSDFDQRKQVRVSVHLKVEFRYGSALIQGKILNISEGGIQIEVNQKLTVGQELKFTILLNEAELFVQIKAKVIWELLNEKYGYKTKGARYKYGIKFLEHSDAIHAQIEKIIADACNQSQEEEIEVETIDAQKTFSTKTPAIDQMNRGSLSTESITKSLEKSALRPSLEPAPAPLEQTSKGSFSFRPREANSDESKSETKSDTSKTSPLKFQPMPSGHRTQTATSSDHRTQTATDSGHRTQTRTFTATFLPPDQSAPTVQPNPEEASLSDSLLKEVQFSDQKRMIYRWKNVSNSTGYLLCLMGISILYLTKAGEVLITNTSSLRSAFSHLFELTLGVGIYWGIFYGYQAQFKKGHPRLIASLGKATFQGVVSGWVIAGCITSIFLFINIVLSLLSVPLDDVLFDPSRNDILPLMTFFLSGILRGTLISVLISFYLVRQTESLMSDSPNK